MTITCPPCVHAFLQFIMDVCIKIMYLSDIEKYAVNVSIWNYLEMGGRERGREGERERGRGRGGGRERGRGRGGGRERERERGGGRGREGGKDHTLLVKILVL